MAKRFDGFFLTFLTYLLLFVWSRYFIKSLALSLIFSGVLCLLLVLSFRGMAKTIKKKPYSADRLANEFALKGNSYAASVIFAAMKNPAAKLSGDTIKLNSVWIICAFKFSGISQSDVASAYQKALAENVKNIVLLCRAADRPSQSLAVGLDVKIEIVKISAVFRYLNKKIALPDLKKQKTKFSLRYIFESALKRQHAKFFAFSGIMLFFLSYFTPLKLYYLCFGTSLFVLAILCLTPLGQIGDDNSGKFFESLENNNENIIENDDRFLDNDFK